MSLSVKQRILYTLRVAYYEPRGRGPKYVFIIERLHIGNSTQYKSYVNYEFGRGRLVHNNCTYLCLVTTLIRW